MSRSLLNILILSLASIACTRQNPFITHMYTADLYFRNNPDIEPLFGWGHEGSPHPFRRSICFDKLSYNENGSINQVIPNANRRDKN